MTAVKDSVTSPNFIARGVRSSGNETSNLLMQPSNCSITCMHHGACTHTGIASPDHSTMFICRICHEGDSKEDLVSPCRCAGTMGLIHLSCVEKWLSSTNGNKCEICGFEYITERKPKPFKDWIRSPTRPTDRRNLYGDAACFLFLTPLASVSSWLCVSGAMHYYSDIRTKWEAVGLLTLSVFLVLVYAVWCLVAARYHHKVYHDWQQSNQVVKVVPINSSNTCPGSEDQNNNSTPGERGRSQRSGSSSSSRDVVLALPLAASSPLQTTVVTTRRLENGSNRHTSARVALLSTFTSDSMLPSLAEVSVDNPVTGSLSDSVVHTDLSSSSCIAHTTTRLIRETFV